MKPNCYLIIVAILTTAVFGGLIYTVNSQTMDQAVTFNGQSDMYNELTDAEKNIIIDKGTEPPFSGKFNDHFEKGTYTCRRCGVKLFESSSKFVSGCGWPSFDDQLTGAVKWQTDKDGVRSEILCSNCDAHLGHVFKGENLTGKNIRYCVNSLSMDFTPAGRPEHAMAIFAGGCFWGVEYQFQTLEGVLSAISGYVGGNIDNPTYQQICTGSTGYAEAVEVIYDPDKTTFEQLAKFFFEIHDFTQHNRQGPDVGTQYRSAVFYLDNAQKQTVVKLIDILEQKGYDVKTAIKPAKKFWPAEDYHQDYYKNNGKVPYCHTRKKIF